MTTLVLLMLGGIWAVVLIVPFIRARSDGSLGDSIGTFRRHLSVLERAAPTSVNPANRLRLPSGQAAIPPYRPPTASGGGRGRQSAFGPMAPTRRIGPSSVSAAAHRRHQAQKRRRDVLFALLAGIAGSLLLSMVHGLGVMLAVNIVLDILFVCYVVLLVRMRNLAAEREMKLTFLPAANARVQPGRPAANVAYARAVGYGDGADYGLPAGY
ncbi:MAG TPA: hypothetical protein VGH66_12410 [Acidimicrobiales bacterium]